LIQIVPIENSLNVDQEGGDAASVPNNNITINVSTLNLQATATAAPMADNKNYFTPSSAGNKVGFEISEKNK